MKSRHPNRTILSLRLALSYSYKDVIAQIAEILKNFVLLRDERRTLQMFTASRASSSAILMRRLQVRLRRSDKLRITSRYYRNSTGEFGLARNAIRRQAKSLWEGSRSLMVIWPGAPIKKGTEYSSVPFFNLIRNCAARCRASLCRFL